MPMNAIATPQEQAALSVQDIPESTDSPLVFYISNLASTVPRWWSPARDEKLEEIWRSEPLLAGAVYSIAAKIAALPWKLTGPERQVRRYQAMLTTADMGLGWVPFIFRIVQDVLTQDNGAFIELLRPKGKGPESPVAGLAHLDPRRCTRTGDPEYPVVYNSARTGKSHKLAWWQVISLADMPSTKEEMRGVGFCAVSRLLHAAQTLAAINRYKLQKVSGKRVPGIIWVKGVRRGVVEEALNAAVEEQRTQGLTHYSKPIVIASPDPGVPVEASLMELASLPDGYDEDVTFRWYVAQLAIAFGVDYGEFAPLPGQGLGTATQSEVQAAKARGKGPGILIQLIQHALNWRGVLPSSVAFEFTSHDTREERDRAEISRQRARTLESLVRSGILTPQQALQVAVDWGEVPESFLAFDVTPDVTGTDVSPVDVGQPRRVVLGQEPTEPERETTLPKQPKEVRRKQHDFHELRATYGAELLAAYETWAHKAADRLADRPEDLEALLDELVATLDLIAQKEFTHWFSALSGGLDDPEAFDLLQSLLQRNKGYLENSLRKDLYDRLQELDWKSAAVTLAALLALSYRVKQYTGAIWPALWLGPLARYRQMGVPVRRVLDPGADHCETCPAKAREYSSIDELLAIAGLPGDGSDACGSNCKCSLEFRLPDGTWEVYV